MLAAVPRPKSAPTALERRQSFEALLALGAAPVPIESSTDLSADGPGGPIALRHYRPAHLADGPSAALIFFHGGGFVTGSLRSHDALCRTLANTIRCIVIAVDYRLAPEHAFPAAFEDCIAAVRWILTHASRLQIDPLRLGLAGDSAGGALAAAATHALPLTLGFHPRLQLLLCPILDCCHESKSRQRFDTGYLIEIDALRDEFAQYLAECDRRDERVSPLLAPDLKEEPMTFIHTAEFDPMCDEGFAYSRRLAEAEVRVHYTCHPGMIHMFYALPRLIPYAGQAMAALAAELAPALQAQPGK